MRGAPAIAIAAALAIAVELETVYDESTDLYEFVKQKSEHLLKSRPTAVNLGNEVKALEEYCKEVTRGTSDVQKTLKS